MRDKLHEISIVLIHQITTSNINTIKISELIMCLLGRMCIGLVARLLPLLSISFASVAPLSEHSSYHYMDIAHCYQHSFYSLQVLPALLLQPVDLLTPLDTPLFLPEQIFVYKVPESCPSYSTQQFLNASKTVFQTLGVLMFVCQSKVVLKCRHHQLMLQYSCKEPLDAIGFMLQTFCREFQ